MFPFLTWTVVFFCDFLKFNLVTIHTYLMAICLSTCITLYHVLSQAAYIYGIRIMRKQYVGVVNMGVFD